MFAGYKKGFCCMGIDYEFIPEYKSGEQKHKSDIISYAGKLLEIVGSDTLIVGVGEDDKPFVWEIPDRLHNALDFSCDTY